MSLSFNEKSIWVSLVLTLSVFGGYFTTAYSVLTAPDTPASTLVPALTGSIVLIVILEAILHIVLGIACQKDVEQGGDERDRLIELRATRIAYFILVLGVWITGMSLLWSATPITMANLILFFFILAQVVAFSLQLIYYRRGL